MGGSCSKTTTEEQSRKAEGYPLKRENATFHRDEKGNLVIVERKDYFGGAVTEETIAPILGK